MVRFPTEGVPLLLPQGQGCSDPRIASSTTRAMPRTPRPFGQQQATFCFLASPKPYKPTIAALIIRIGFWGSSTFFSRDHKRILFEIIPTSKP